MRFALLMYTEPARTETMTAADRAEIKDKYTRLGTELLASASYATAAGWPAQLTTAPSGRSSHPATPTARPVT